MIPDARVITTAKKFAGELSKRWRAVKGEINTYVIEEDALGLKEPQPGDPIADGGFDFRDNAEKEEQFRNWYESQLRSEVLEPVGDKQLREGGHYTAKYLRSSNASGLRDAGTRMREENITPQFSRDELETMFNLPVRTEQLATLYRRDFAELKGITEAVSQAVSRQLSDGLAAGHNPRKIASAMNEEIDTIGLTRSRVLARTETVRSYNHASLLRYNRNGIKKVNIKNTNPCSECAAVIADNPYPVDEAYGILPIHPNCRGAFSPVVPGAT